MKCKDCVYQVVIERLTYDGEVLKESRCSRHSNIGKDDESCSDFSVDGIEMKRKFVINWAGRICEVPFSAEWTLK